MTFTEMEEQVYVFFPPLVVRETAEKARVGELRCLLKLSVKQYMMLFSCSVMSNTLRHYGLQPTRLLCPWNF